MTQTKKVRIGKKRTIVIPKKFADRIGLREGSYIKMILTDDNKIIMEPIIDATWLSLYGEKIGRISLEELEMESVEEQRKYIEKKT